MQSSLTNNRQKLVDEPDDRFIGSVSDFQPVSKKSLTDEEQQLADSILETDE